MAADLRPFGAGALRVWTIPPGTDFLGSLARELARAFDLKNKAADKIVEHAEARPITTLAAVVGIGFLAGWLCRRQ